MIPSAHTIRVSRGTPPQMTADQGNAERSFARRNCRLKGAAEMGSASSVICAVLGFRREPNHSRMQTACEQHADKNQKRT
jgi:hypothetical protein